MRDVRSIVKVEGKRILRKEFLFIFFVVILLLSVSSSYQAVKSYELWDMDGTVISGKENLKHGKENGKKKSIKEAIAILRNKEEAIFVDETNIAKLVALNYSDKNVENLSDEEINLFFKKRLSTIEQSLNENSYFSYTEREIEQLMENAKRLDNLMVGFSEGWKVLNHDIGSFVPLVLIMISIIIMPLFADDAQTRMKELSCSTKNGKKQLAQARIITAFGMGSLLYFITILIYFLIKMLPLGFTGSSEYIQSNEDTFFSVFHITYIEQFVWNCIRGYVSLIFVISMTLLISVTMERIISGVVVVYFYWVLLLIMEKMMSFEVNHLFANFMPLRLAGSTDFYTRNEIYRFAGKTFESMVWCPIVALLISFVMVGIALWWLYKRMSKAKRYVI